MIVESGSVVNLKLVEKSAMEIHQICSEKEAFDVEENGILVEVLVGVFVEL